MSQPWCYAWVVYLPERLPRLPSITCKGTTLRLILISSMWGFAGSSGVSSHYTCVPDGAFSTPILQLSNKYLSQTINTGKMSAIAENPEGPNEVIQVLFALHPKFDALHFCNPFEVLSYAQHNIHDSGIPYLVPRELQSLFLARIY